MDRAPGPMAHLLKAEKSVIENKHSLEVTDHQRDMSKRSHFCA